MNEPSQKKDNTGTCSSKLCGLICFLAACGLIGVLVHHFGSAHSEAPRRLWLPVVVETNGNETVLGDTRQLEFWTPSVRTRDFLHKEGEEVASGDKWQVVPSDDAVLQFGSVLHSNHNVLGYRRIEVFGQGRTSFKPGWWWTVNVLTNYTVSEFAATYRGYWKSPQAVFVEVIDNRGHDN